MRLSPLILLLLCSCQKINQIEKLELSYGIQSPILLDDNKVSFLANIEHYYKSPAVVKANSFGEIEYLYKLECYTENIVEYPYFKLLNQENTPVIFFKKERNVVDIHKLSAKNNIVIKEITNPYYASLFRFNNESIYIKSGEYNYRNYEIAYYNLSNDFEILESKVMNFGSSLPLNPIIIQEYIFYHRENILYKHSLKDDLEKPIYKFDGEVVTASFKNNNLYVLLQDTLIIFDSNGIPVKGLGFRSDDVNLDATNITFTKNNNYIISLKTDNSYQFKYIQDSGSVIREHVIENKEIIGDCIIWGETIEHILFSDQKTLYFAPF